MWLGPVLFLRSIGDVIVFILLYWLYYERIMFCRGAISEEKNSVIFMDKWSEKVALLYHIHLILSGPRPSFFDEECSEREYNSFVNIFSSSQYLIFAETIFVRKDLFDQAMAMALCRFRWWYGWLSEPLKKELTGWMWKEGKTPLPLQTPRCETRDLNWE